MTEPTKPNWVPVESTTECKRCGKKSLAWQQGKSGKWYLAITRRNAEGQLEADRRGFHKCEPAAKNINNLEVSDADVPF